MSFYVLVLHSTSSARSLNSVEGAPALLSSLSLSPLCLPKTYAISLAILLVGVVVFVVGRLLSGSFVSPEAVRAVFLVFSRVSPDGALGWLSVVLVFSRSFKQQGRERRVLDTPPSPSTLLLATLILLDAAVRALWGRTRRGRSAYLIDRGWCSAVCGLRFTWWWWCER